MTSLVPLIGRLLFHCSNVAYLVARSLLGLRSVWVRCLCERCWLCFVHVRCVLLCGSSFSSIDFLVATYSAECACSIAKLDACSDFLPRASYGGYQKWFDHSAAAFVLK